jgi:hypothetical protein
MSTSPMPPVRLLAERAERAYRDAWLSLLLFLGSLVVSLAVFLAIAHGVGWTTMWATSYPAGRYSPSGWAGRGVWLLMTALYACPEILVVHFARRARRLGRPEWLAPVILGGVLAGLLPLLNFGLLVG